MTETYDWGGADGDGCPRSAPSRSRSPAPPSPCGRTVRLAPAGSGTQITIDGDLKASIPLFGGKVEKAAAPAVIDAIRSEQRTGNAWLSERA